MLSRIARPFLEKTLRPVLVEAGAGFDVAVVRLVQEIAKRGSKRSEDLESRRRYLDHVAAIYGAVDPAQFYAEPPAIDDMHEHRVRDLEPQPGDRFGASEVVDLTYASGWTCHEPAQRERWAKWRENGTVHVRLFRHRRKSGLPAVICIHGYRAGSFAFEERAWAASWLHRLGLDVALFTLPFHALRAPANRRGTPLFPTADVARTNEAFGQAMWDLRKLARWLSSQGASQVGVMGMSLGGYTTSLFATVEPSLAFAVPFIPLADLTDVVVDHERLRGVVVPQDLVDAGKRAMALVRPLGRAPVVPKEKMLIVAAEGDRITKHSHAESLSRHFGCEMVTFGGAHLLQFGRRDGFAAIARFLAKRGVIQPRP